MKEKGDKLKERPRGGVPQLESREDNSFKVGMVLVRVLRGRQESLGVNDR